MKKNAKIFVAGHRGMVGSAIVRSLSKRGYSNILVSERQNLDLLDQRSVMTFLTREACLYFYGGCKSRWDLCK